MPTVFRKGPYRFFFFSGDRDEPVHIHVESEGKIAKFWLDPVRLASSIGYSRVELIKIQKIVEQNKQLLEEAWNEYFGKGD